MNSPSWILCFFTLSLAGCATNWQAKEAGPPCDFLSNHPDVREFVAYPIFIGYAVTLPVTDRLKRWKPSGDVDTPWVAPNKRASQYSKKQGLYQDTTTAWEDSKGRKLLVDDAFKSSDKFLLDAGYVASWRAIDSGSDESRSAAPFQFYLVSIDPTVIILIPSDRPVSNPAPLYYQVKPTIFSEQLINRIHYGTSLPFATNAKWFCPDHKAGLSELLINETGNGAIEFGDEELVFTKRAHQWHVYRQSRRDSQAAKR